VHRLRADCRALSSWRWAQRCSKHVEDHDVILLLNK
jgi:hypothetical protein